MTHAEKVLWMNRWAEENGCSLDLQGECGFGRECVGITKDGNYPDYISYDDDYNDTNHVPDMPEFPNAYHKHPCVAVLGRGEEAESTLYDWLKWFDDNGYTVISEERECKSIIEVMMGKGKAVRIAKKVEVPV